MERRQSIFEQPVGKTQSAFLATLKARPINVTPLSEERLGQIFQAASPVEKPKLQIEPQSPGVTP